MSPRDALGKAVETAKGQSALARMIGRKQQDIWRWLNVTHQAAPEAVIAIEAATGVSRHDLRPDLYPRDGREVAA